jgi:8-oxo-dGTP pyrophosphatase MutT (NUDIX family)
MNEEFFSDLRLQLESDRDHPDAVAAVLILISRSESPSILYARRALHLRSHPGEICFPGGKREEFDENLWATALRETQEEIGLPASEIEYLGSLEPAKTRAGTQVIPFVASFNANYPVAPFLEELDLLFNIPIVDFRNGLKVCDDHFEHNGLSYYLPVYQYDQHRIWGFTAIVTQQLLKHLKF